MRVFIVSRGYTRRSTVKAAIAPAFLSCQRYSLPFSISLGLFPVVSKVIPLLFPAFWICPWTDMCVCVHVFMAVLNVQASPRASE